MRAAGKLSGVYNFTNPGTISHNECLDLYKEHIDSSYSYSNFTVEEQASVPWRPLSQPSASLQPKYTVHLSRLHNSHRPLIATRGRERQEHATGARPGG